jgi:hypothetical protein
MFTGSMEKDDTTEKFHRKLKIPIGIKEVLEAPPVLLFSPKWLNLQRTERMRATQNRKQKQLTDVVVLI